ncbi:Putative COPII coat assembly protein, Sec16 [Septoria linicola]|uniref:Protein transport protein sec16 n=1 Tax=Septoria linicola TaxID=215465 RepID=A0A9Q9AR35_9PEZI|nr:Putative COPII coat assembly protein, Sec16 [Septoria linicola]
MSDAENGHIDTAATSTSSEAAPPAAAAAAAAAGESAWNPAHRPDSDTIHAPTTSTVEDDSSAPASAIEDILGDEEAPIDHREETAAEQEQEPEQQMPDPSRQPLYISSPGLNTPVAHDVELDNDLSRNTEQSEAYEHQGDLTQMEEAVDEAPTAPLLEDEEAPPTVDEREVNRAPTMDVVQEDSILEDADEVPAFGTSLPKHKAMLGQLDRSFTTNFTEIPAVETEQEQEESRPDSSDWPSAGDDKTFGELLDTEQPDIEQTSSSHVRGFSVDPVSKPQSDPWGNADDDDDDTFGELLGDAQPQSSSEVPVAQAEDVSSVAAHVTIPEDTTEDDLAAAFASVLLDDDLLEDPKDMDMSAIFGDDDPGFLDDELLTDTAPVSGPAPILPPAETGPGLQRAQSAYTPAAVQQRAQQPNPYAASGPQFGQHGRSAGTPSTGLYDVFGHGAIQQQQPQRPAAQTAQSFVDKAKGGYQSPYDLPMEVVKPKQRPRQAPLQNQPAPVAPPRTSSMSSQQGRPTIQQPPAMPPAGFTPPLSAGIVPAPPPSTNGVVPQKGPARQSSGFFEDLPVVPKARARPSGAYTPQPQVSATPPGNQMPPRGPSQPMQQPQRPQAPPTPAQQSMYGGFTQPERLPLLPDQPTAPTPIQTPAAPPTNQLYSPNTLPAPSQPQNRFSPAPPSQAPPAAGARYSPAPPAQAAPKRYPSTSAAAPAIQNAHAFAPRTSSPLAFHGRPQQGDAADQSRGPPSLPSSPPKSNGRSSPAIMSPQRSGNQAYSPSGSRAPSLSNLASPPQRPLTQSPPAQMKVSKYAAQVPTEMPASTGAPSAAPSSKKAFLAHRRQFSRDLNFVAPQDEHAQDPLQRWKGYPIFRWGDSGAVISSLPKQTPFYAAGHGGPSIKCTPGSITVQQATTFMPLDELSAKFPGPLPSKSKKKRDILAWMTSKIETLHQNAEAVRMNFDIEPDLKKRIDEKSTLWRIMKIFVEHDGKLEGDKKIEEEVRAVLLPNLAQMGQAMELQSPVHTPGAGLQADAVDRTVILQLRQALLEGDRERAVWLAEEKKLWGHAMLIASTMGPALWQQIVQSFVRSQVKTVGSDARSLAALYQVFANNAEECVDELVPPSARAGFQMMSKNEGAVSKNPLEGLDQWQETLGLVASNRTPADGNSLLALGKLLSSYGRAEAAHTCFLFARVLAKHTGADDPEATFVLLGANHQRQDESFGNDLDSILLTEIYEWATSFSQQRSEYIPHLQAFKFKHAQELAAAGLRNQAQAYCDHITKAYQSTTKPSQYYHPTFTQAVADLGAFLSQTPQTGPQGLLSKVSSAKVSSSASSWFTKFVSGDDDQASNASGAGSGAAGPFGRVNGDSPDINRVGSTTDMHQMYNPMMGGMPSYGQPGVSALTQQFQPSSAPMQQFQPSSAPGNSRYAPGAAGGNKYAPMSAGSLSSNEQRPGTSSSRSYASSPQPLAVPRPELNKAASDYSMSYGNDSRRGSAQFSSGSYEPRPLLAEQPTSHSYSPLIQHEEVPSYPAQASFDDLPNSAPQQDDNVADAEGGTYEPPATSGYDPGNSYGYEPPAYVPYEPEPEAEEAEDKPKPRRGMMDDDDDDIMARASAIKQSSPAPSSSMSKSDADRIAEENFKKAAEADAARDAQKKGGEKKGWGIGLGGWFGGKKGEQGMPQQQQNGPIKAKLGEENSFYFDKDLGKWVNKKDPKASDTAAAATPPPPKGPPSRNISGAMGPPSGPPSRVSSGSGMPPPGARPPPSIPGSGPPSRVGTPAAGSESGSLPSALTNPAVAALSNGTAPPSRPGTSLSNASSIDDLLGGPPGPRKGGTAKKAKKGGRYVDVMAAK